MIRVREAIAVLGVVLSGALAARADDPGAAAPAPPPAAPAGAPPAAAAPAEAPPPEDAPPAVLDEVVVTATRSPRPIRDVPAAVTVLPRAEIQRSPSKTVDELLRIVPSFGLFRRTSSLVSDPTAQGVNLRGIGPSGVSRSLVLVDGVPANDPFGGWVYWRDMPSIGIQSIEVVPGGGSALYGNYALGGVTQVFSRPITPRTFDALAEGGGFGSSRLSLRATDRWGPIGAVVETDLLRSDGHRVVAPSARGAVDGAASSEHAAVDGRIEARPTPDLLLSLRGGTFYEAQDGGTRYTNALVRRREYVLGARWTPGALGEVDLTFFGHRNWFEQERARIQAVAGVPRAREEQAAKQDVPAHDAGAGLVWTSRALPLAGRDTLTVGADGRRITGSTRERLFPAGDPVAGVTVLRRDATAEQRLVGAFVQDVYDLSDAVSATAAIRFDRWDNLDAVVTEERFATPPAPVRPPDRHDRTVSPKVGLRVRPLDWLTVRAAAYRAFRAPTMNELYRAFQVGPVLTEANPDLGPETLRGGEAGLELATPGGVVVRTTGFWNLLDDPILNVTLRDGAGVPIENARRRQNLGQARIRGVEVEAAWRVSRAWSATAAYTLADSRVMDAPGEEALVGNELPQDPRHRASVSLAFEDPRLLSAVAQVRYVGRQFEDDLNTQPMAAAAVVDVSASRRLGGNLELVLAVENLFDREYLVGRAGNLPTIGQPRFVHGGVRLRYGAER